MSTNFDFLKIDLDTTLLFETANKAEENYTYEDYDGVLTKTRKLAEECAKMVLDQEYQKPGANLHENLKMLSPRLPQEIHKRFNFLRKMGNSASHQINSSQATKENALQALEVAFQLLVWYMKTYTLEDAKVEYMAFFEPEARSRYQTAERKFIYIQSADTAGGDLSRYEGVQKIGEGTIPEDDMEADWQANSDFLRKEAPKRINQYMKTAGLKFDLGWVELAYIKKEKRWFHDKDVHRVLLRSSIKRSEKLDGFEWFETDLETAKKAIAAVKAGQSSLQTESQGQSYATIVLRPEQETAVAETVKVYKKKNKMLWNAKMRFGKTLTALELVKQEHFKKVLILTHRPVVKDSWHEDFNKMKMADLGYLYGSDTAGESLTYLKKSNQPFIYFASIQKLRYGQGQVNLAAFADVDWDFLIIDEAHEGTQTNLSAMIFDQLVKDETKVLELSGTPFNLLNQYDEDQVYTWDYTMEQEAKLRWQLTKPGQENPYEKLPEVKMYTFEMRQQGFLDANKSFNFREFFRVNEAGKLVYEREVRAFLDNISNLDSKTDYPFATKAYREQLRHTLWLMPGVKEANAFEDLLKTHPIFGKDYQIVNVVRGSQNDRDNGITSDDDLAKVRRAIGPDPSLTKTITLTVRKLTTGVNVPEWTAVLFLSNTNSPMNYLQAAFRAQTPFSHEKLGMKKECYIFDFAPDRALTVMAESAQINSGVGKKNTQTQKTAMTRLLNFLPILGSTETGMKPYNVDKMLTQLKKVYAEKAVRSGFEDDSLYNDQLLTLTADDASLFNNLKGIVGTTNKEKKTKVVVNENGLTDEEYDQAEKVLKKKPRERTEEEKAVLEKLKEAKNQRKAMISILRGVSIRIPMMIYGMTVDLDEDIDIRSFIKLVDDQSWKEFMPKGFSKDLFRDIVKYYDPEVFIEAGRIIRQRAKSFDSLDVITRAEKIAELFSTFKNPDKETVLTPWRVVNLQVSKTVGGLNFYDDNYQSTTTGATSNLHWVEQAESSSLYQADKTFLDINAKTGLYPLHAAISLYYKAVADNDDPHFDEFATYQRILRQNVYAIAKTPMAKTITQRTLAGYNPYATNVAYIKDFEKTIKANQDQAIQQVKETFSHVKFDVIIGNPPYQSEGIGVVARDEPIYHQFMELSYQIADKVVLITPGRFLFNAGQTPAIWNKKMLDDEHLKVIFYAHKSDEVFPNTDIKGGVAVTYRNNQEIFGPIETFTPIGWLNDLRHLVKKKITRSFNEYWYGKSSYKFSNKLYEYYPDLRGRVSAAEEKSIGSNIFEKLPEIFSNEKERENQIGLYGRLDNERVTKYIDADLVEEHPNLNKYKVFVPASNGSGSIGEVLSTPLVGTPLVGHTQTFISFGAFETSTEAENCLKYIKTDLARAMLGILKVTQHNQSKEVWSNVPWFDFKDYSVIDWSKSVAEIEEQLYTYFEIPEFIKEKLKVSVKKMN